MGHARRHPNPRLRCQKKYPGKSLPAQKKFRNRPQKNRQRLQS